MKYTCDRCEKTTDKAINVEGEGLCQSCYDDMATLAEYLYESARDEGRI